MCCDQANQSNVDSESRSRKTFPGCPPLLLSCENDRWASFIIPRSNWNGQHPFRGEGRKLQTRVCEAGSTCKDLQRAHPAPGLCWLRGRPLEACCSRTLPGGSGGPSAGHRG